jgi:3-phosphoshikimate 1-carboxyvinyltransferase
MPAENVYSLSPLSATRDAAFSARLPGSKSFTNRALLLAAQRSGTTEVTNALHAEDTELLAKCLDGFKGLTAEKAADGFRLSRRVGRLGAPDHELFIGGAGTPARFLLSFAAEADGATVVTGIPRLCERPMGHILEALERVGIATECLQTPGCVPARIHGGEPVGTEWEIDGSVSSQFVSSLMLLAGRRPAGSAPITVRVPGHLVSRPYVEMTAQIMNQVGIRVEEAGPAAWRITPAEPKHSRIEIEPDASAMSYVLGAAAITGSKVSVPGIGSGSKQGDVGFARIMEAMGCRLTMDAERIEIEGSKDGLHGVDVDMELMPDVVLTLAVVAAFAKGPTRITNIANLRVKECDRIDAAATELGRMGVKAIQHDDSLEIHPGDPIRPARIETYNDHRVAMSFALAGLLRPGIEIADPGCVAKSFPNFWEEYERFKAHHSAEAEHV